MKKYLILLAVIIITITGCNKEVFDLSYNFSKVHLYETNRCYEIKSWRDYDGEQLQVKLVNYGTIIVSSTGCLLVSDICPICNQ